jgi:hypothetical protein
MSAQAILKETNIIVYKFNFFFFLLNIILMIALFFPSGNRHILELI